MDVNGYSTPTLLPWEPGACRLPLQPLGAMYSLRALCPDSGRSWALWLYQDAGGSWSWQITCPDGEVVAVARRRFCSLTRCETVLLWRLRQLTPWLVLDRYSGRLQFACAAD